MLTFILHVLCYDIWFYLSHIMLHSRLLWKYHVQHHQIIHPKYTDTYKGHALEGPFQSLGFLLPVTFLPLAPWQALTALLFVNLRGMARHDDRTVPLIGNHHLLHHEFVCCNYGEYWLDKLCGTLIKDKTKIKKGVFYV